MFIVSKSVCKQLVRINNQFNPFCELCTWGKIGMKAGFVKGDSSMFSC